MQPMHANTSESIHVMSFFFFLSQNWQKEEIEQENINKVRTWYPYIDRWKVLDTKIKNKARKAYIHQCKISKTINIGV